MKSTSRDGRTAGTMPDEERKSRARRFFEQAWDLFAEAADGCGDRPTRSFDLAGDGVRITCAGPALAQKLFPAFQHLPPVPASSKRLDIVAWDSRSTKTPMLPVPWESSAFGPRGEIEGFNEDSIRTLYLAGENVLHIADLATDRAVFWIRDAEETPSFIRAAPFRAILTWWFESRSLVFSHAGAVGHATGGALIIGKGGSGKSTACLSALDQGLLYAGDDYVVVRAEPEPFVYSVYSTAKLAEGHLKNFPRWASRGVRTPLEKTVLFLSDHAPDALTAGFPIHIILLPRVRTGRSSRTEDVRPAVALRELASSTFFQIPQEAGGALGVLAQLVRNVPCRQLIVGSDLAAVGAAVRDSLA